MKSTQLEEFESWYSREHSRILSAVVLATGDLYLSQDAVDEAIVRAYDRWKRVGSMDSPSGWTLRVALNLVKRNFRRANRVYGTPALDTQESVFPSTLHEVWKLVNRLSKRQREVVVLRYIGDLTEAQVADALGITRGTVSQTLRSAHLRLGEMLSDYVETKGNECDVSK